MVERLVDRSRESTDEALLETSLRPTALDEYIGQEQVKENLRILIEAAQHRGDTIDHILFCGPPGLGKTTLAHIIAVEMGVNFKSTSGPVVERPGDLAALLTNLQQGDIFFIDEIHRLPHVIEEILYPAMEDFQLDIIIGQGPSARTIKLALPRFTLVGATTRAGLLTSPLRDRFGVVIRLDFYAQEELQTIVSRSAQLLQIGIDEAGTAEIARRSRGTPRIANRLLKRVRDYAQVRADGFITQVVAAQSLHLLEVDDFGLDKMDRQLLLTIIDKFSGGPVGLETLAASINEERETIEDVYEPFLLQSGYLKRTPRGRTATPWRTVICSASRRSRSNPDYCRGTGPRAVIALVIPDSSVFPPDVIFDGRDVLCRADDKWHALVQLGRLHMQDIFGASAGTAASLLSHEGQRRRFIEQAQFAGGFLRIGHIGRIQKDPAREQGTVKIGHQGADIPSLIRFVVRVLQAINVPSHPRAPGMVIPLIGAVGTATFRHVNIFMRQEKLAETRIEGIAMHAVAGGVDEHRA